MIKLNRRRFLKGTSITAAALAAPAVITRRNILAADPIVVGAMHDRTGSHGIYGKEADDSVKFVTEEINAAGGVLGQQLELIAFDTQSNMQNYAQYAQRLSTQPVDDFLRRHLALVQRFQRHEHRAAAP